MKCPSCTGWSGPSWARCGECGRPLGQDRKAQPVTPDPRQGREVQRKETDNRV